MPKRRPEEGSPHSLARIADRYRKQGRFDDAVTICLQALSARPTYMSARVVLGRAYLERGDHAKAEEEFRRVLELSPEQLRARIHLGQICEARGRMDEAIRHYEAALELAPLDREIQGSLLRLRGPVRPPDPLQSRTTEAPESPLDLLPSRPAEAEGDLFATATLGDLYASQGLTDRARAIYQHLLDREPFREGIRAKLAALQERRQEAEAPESEAPQPASVPRPPPLLNDFQEPADVVAVIPGRMRREQVLIDELERWLRGVRRYRELTRARP